MTWLPYGVTLQTKLSRVTFPPQQDSCVPIPPDDFWGLAGNVSCDFPQQALAKMMSYRLASDAFIDVRTLVNGLVLKTSEQSAMMSGIVSGADTWASIAWNISCGFLRAHPARWTSLIKNTVPPTPPPAPHILKPQPGLLAGIYCCVLTVLVLGLLLHALLIRYQQRPEIKGSSVQYCHVMSAGSLAAGIAIMMAPNVGSNDAACALIPIFLSLGFNLIYGSAFPKTYRIYKVHYQCSLNNHSEPHSLIRLDNFDIHPQISYVYSCYCCFHFLTDILSEVDASTTLESHPVVLLDRTQQLGCGSVHHLGEHRYVQSAPSAAQRIDPQ
jgi:hypothetical protein